MPLPPCLPSFFSLPYLHSGLLSAAAAALSPCMISIMDCSWLPLPPCLPSFVSLHDLHTGLLLAWLPLPPCLPAWSPFWAALGCPCRLVSLHDLHCGLLLAAAAALSPFICLPAWSPYWAALGLAAAAALSPCMISILGCSWLPLPPCLPSFVSAWSPFWAALGCCCRLVTLHLSPAWSPFWAALGCRCRLVSLHDLHSGLLLAAAALSPFILPPCMISILGLLLAAAAALSPFICLPVFLHLSPCMISLLGCSWLPLRPCLPSYVPLPEAPCSSSTVASPHADSCAVRPCLPSRVAHWRLLSFFGAAVAPSCGYWGTSLSTWTTWTRSSLGAQLERGHYYITTRQYLELHPGPKSWAGYSAILAPIDSPKLTQPEERGWECNLVHSHTGQPMGDLDDPPRAGH